MSLPDSPSAPSAGAGPLPLATPLASGLDVSVRTPATAAPRLAPAMVAVGGEALPSLSASDYLEAAPAWLISAIVHMMLVIILGLCLIVTEQAPQLILSLSMDGEGEDLNTGDLDVPMTLDESPLEAGDSSEPMELATADTTEFSTTAPPVAALGLEATTEVPAIEISLTGRTAGMKDSLLRAYGGTAGTETSVAEALKWLARNQGKDSLWSLKGPYTDGAGSDNQEAATAMALLAYQGAGYTPMSDRKAPYTSVVTKAWRTMLKRQKKDGSFFQDGSPNGRLYTEGLCTIALCELYGMTKDSEYRDAAQRSVDYCLKVQSAEGGWRYQPGFDSDTSVTGWFVMALQSARMAGLEVDREQLGRIHDYLDTVSQDGGSQYAYLPGQGKKISMTAEGLLCRQYLGWSRSDPRLRRGVNVLLDNLPKYEDGRSHVYYWYYGAQVCHHMEAEPWRKWNHAMRETLPSLQIREGKERGSWDPTLDDTTGVGGGGRLFVTCLATYSLEVYYRHLPLYRLEALAAGQ